MKQITLIRHGKPVFELSGSVRARDLRKHVIRYNASGISDTPPPYTIELAKEHHIVVCSDLIRSVESAQALGFDEIHASEPLFGEAAIPHFSRGSVKLPVNTWIILLRTLSLMGFSKNGESFRNTKKRAMLAADKLVQLADQYGRVLLVGHGFINYFIARELLASGWTGPARPGKDFWGFGIYQNHVGNDVMPL
jgi:broad specificity phosphatase PhoE